MKMLWKILWTPYIKCDNRYPFDADHLQNLHIDDRQCLVIDIIKLYFYHTTKVKP